MGASQMRLATWVLSVAMVVSVSCSSDGPNIVETGGSCTGKICIDGNPCTQDQCVDGECQFPVTQALPCDDSNACTTEDRCLETSVCAGTEKSCDDENPCTVDSCLSESGECVHVELPNGTPCGQSDDPCVVLRCQSGVCATSTVSVCSDGCSSAPLPGCDGCACESCVCDMAPDCCKVAWTSSCATLCASACGACGSVCGDGQCDGEETCDSCLSDCGACPVVCGDGKCEGAESCTTCSADCGACPVVCGDGKCEGAETCTTCSADCGACPVVCGDGTCEGAENCTTCSADCGACPVVCGDGKCESVEGCTCSTDCGSPCGNNVCDCGETVSTCLNDCAVQNSCVGMCGGQALGCYCQPDCLDFKDCCPDACTLCGICAPVCGDGKCETAEVCSCASDCGPSCGNGTCDCDEVPGACILDCGDPNSCVGQCGGPAQDCSCEPGCLQTGKCCLDACATCGICNDVCGNGLCEAGEACGCPSDCGISCGNSICDCGETTASCSQDCQTGTDCEGMCGGQAVSGCYCSPDCVQFQDCCPDACASCGICDALPTDVSCAGQCGGKTKYCWCDPFCIAALDCCEDACSECGTCASCGDGICDPLEDSCGCALDCGAHCGNGACDCEESATTCPGDCKNPNSCSGQCGGNAGNCWCDPNCFLSQDCCDDACSECGACAACEDLVPGAMVKKVFVVTPCRFDGNNPADVAHFIALANAFADTLVAVEPFQSMLGKFSVKMSLDFSAATVADGDCWYNPTVIAAAGGCVGMTHVLSIANNSGEAGGNWGDGFGTFSVAGSGLTIGCDPTTCTAPEGFTCPPADPPHNCTWDAALPFSLLHEMGHTLGLGHSCSNDIDPPNLSGPSDTSSDVNCAFVSSGNETVACPKWNHPDILTWKMPGDPPLGCYAGCGDGFANWYRSWKRGGVMCRDDFLSVGFTPISRKIIRDQLLGGCDALAGKFCGIAGVQTCHQDRYVLCLDFGD